MNSLYRRFFSLLLLAVFFPWNAGAGQSQDQFTLVLPAPAIHQTLRTVLPLPLEPDSASFNGSLSIDSIESLTIHDEIISVHGIVSGKNLAISTEIAGQKIKLKLGQVTMPLSCDLHVRFDQARQQLFITPQLIPGPDNGDPGAEALLPLLALLGNREYPVDLKKLLSFNPTFGGESKPLQIEAVRIMLKNNQMTFKLRPQKTKSD